MILVYQLVSEQENLTAQDHLDDVGQKDASISPVYRIARIFIRQFLVPAIRSRKQLEYLRVKYRRKIISAGVKDIITSDEMIGLKILLAVVLPIIGLVLEVTKVYELGTIVISALPAVGFFLPDLWLNSTIQKRHKEVLKTLPFVVDLLALSTEAGLDFVGAMHKVVEKAPPGPLIEEIGQVLKDIQLGSSRASALREMSIRINLKETSSFVAVLISAEQMGAPVGNVLRQQSTQVRNERFIRAEKAGGKAAASLLLPMIPLLFAVIAILLGAFLVGGEGFA
jgi:tight adherence protein C